MFDAEAFFIKRAALSLLIVSLSFSALMIKAVLE
jgi:hypothetical protein